MKTRPVWIAVGGNLEPERAIEGALEALRESLGLRKVSVFYRTPALGRPEQPDFLNGAFLCASALEPARIKAEILRPLERRLGRVRGNDRYAARTIDLDLALCGELVIEEEGLTLPDPELRMRPFLALPLLDLTPELIMPDSGRRLADEIPATWRGNLVAELEFTNRLRERLEH